MKQNYTFTTDTHCEGKPFLTIVTRCMEGKRPKGISANWESVNNQLHKNFEQIFINDPVGYGMLEANKSFAYVTDIAKGEYVHLLDDDDFYTNDMFTKQMENIARMNGSPNIIFFKMKIWTGDGDNIYPKPDCWGDIPKIARIGGSCFIVRKDVYDKHIHAFGLRRCGDFNFLKTLWRDNPKAIWHDEMMCESKPSHGKAEHK